VYLNTFSLQCGIELNGFLGGLGSGKVQGWLASALWNLIIARCRDEWGIQPDALAEPNTQIRAFSRSAMYVNTAKSSRPLAFTAPCSSQASWLVVICLRDIRAHN
jgi:hypothetical protein